MTQTRFGFIPSDELANLIDSAFARLAQGSKQGDPLYPYRNELIERIGNEIIETQIIQVAHNISNPERRQRIEKLGKLVQSVVNKIIHAMLSKDSDQQVLESLQFLRDSVARDAEGNLRVGYEIPPDLYQHILSNIEAISNGEHNEARIAEVQEAFKLHNDLLLNHFMSRFVKTLGWGMVKRKMASGTEITITKATAMAIDHNVPKTPLKEMQEIVPIIDQQFFKTDTPQAYPA